MPSRSPSLDTLYTLGELVEMKRGFRFPWEGGRVKVVSAHQIHIQALRGGRTYLIEPGKRGKVRKPTGSRLDDLITLITTAARARDAARAAEPIIARTGGTPQPVPRPRARYRDGTYLDYVRGWPCTGCGAPAPSEAHHAGPRGVGQRADDYLAVPLCRTCHQGVTDTAILPSHRPADPTPAALRHAQGLTEVAILRAQVGLLVEWQGRAMAPALPQADARFIELAPLRLERAA